MAVKRTRGRPTTAAMPDKKWTKSQLARLERDAAHFRELGRADYFEPLEAKAAELRKALTTRGWRSDKPWQAWTQRQRGIVHAQTYDPLEARRLALRMAVSGVELFFAALDAGEPVGPDSEVYQFAEQACADAADTLGNPRAKVPLSKTLEIIQRKIARGELPERVEFLRRWRERARWLLVVEFATGASLDTLLKLFA